MDFSVWTSPKDAKRGVPNISLQNDASMCQDGKLTACCSQHSQPDLTRSYQILPDLRPQDSPPGKRILNAPLEFSPRAHVIMFRCSRYAASHRTHGIRLGFKTVVWNVRGQSGSFCFTLAVYILNDKVSQKLMRRST